MLGADAFLALEKRARLASEEDHAQDLKCIVQSIWAAGGATTSENQQLASLLPGKS